jgi:hypothetical protein
VINNASDEALLSNIIDPLIGCTPFLGPSLDNPGTMVPALALSELQAAALQAAPVGLVPLNDPDTLLTSSGTVSIAKTNEYRLGVNQPVVAAGNDSGALVPYCNAMLAVAPRFLANNQAKFIGQTTPAACVGNNLFTFLCMRFIMSLAQLTCPVAQEVNPVTCKVDGNGVATSCTINLKATATRAVAASTVGAVTATTTSKVKAGKGPAGTSSVTNQAAAQATSVQSSAALAKFTTSKAKVGKTAAAAAATTGIASVASLVTAQATPVQPSVQPSAGVVATSKTKAGKSSVAGAASIANETAAQANPVQPNSAVAATSKAKGRTKPSTGSPLALSSPVQVTIASPIFASSMAGGSIPKTKGAGKSGVARATGIAISVL